MNVLKALYLIMKIEYANVKINVKYAAFKNGMMKQVVLFVKTHLTLRFQALTVEDSQVTYGVKIKHNGMIQIRKSVSMIVIDKSIHGITKLQMNV